MRTITVNIRRHSLSNKKDAKKDYSISPEGWDLAVAKGREIVVPEGGIVAYASPKTRAQETARGVLFGAYQTNYQTRQINWNAGAVVRPELDSMAGYITKIPDVKAVFDSMPLDEGVNLILSEDPEAVKRAGNEILDLIVYATRRALPYTEIPVLADGTTHGAKVESGLINILSMMQVPVKDVKEIGGAFKETEHFSVELHQNEKNTALHKVSFRGETYRNSNMMYVASWLNEQ
jgi:hypothetical protein